jgi:hypothetical protein
VGILEILRTDHDEIKSKLDTLAEEHARTPGSPGRSRKVDLFFQCKLATVSHNRAEEGTLYAALKGRPQTARLVGANPDEHLIFEELLRDLEQLNGKGYEWRNALIVLRERLEDHMRREEHKIFAAARAEFTEEELLRLAVDYEALRGEIIEGFAYHPMGRTKINPAGLDLGGR